jgi:predicted HTH transcriptional regulator
MHIRHRKIDEIEEGDLQEIIQHKDSESKIIDYKRELPKDNPEGKKEFLYDVSSFANTSGGHLIYGMDEEKGIVH